MKTVKFSGANNRRKASPLLTMTKRSHEVSLFGTAALADLGCLGTRVALLIQRARICPRRGV
jgi:hypothetical protein